MTFWRVPYPKFGAGPGLGRVSKIAGQLNLNLAGFGASGAVITGSNGKGSTAAMSAAVLRQLGGPVGLFTSPHLFAHNERFNIDGENIGDNALAHHWRRVADAVEAAGEGDALGGFEFLFLIAADWFAARGCAHTIWEAGIGGRLDPTRLIEAGRTALTSLDLEHTDLLGETLAEIAAEKIDAAPAGALVFVSESCASEREAIVAHCASRRVTAIFVGVGDHDGPLAGAFQRENTALAVRVARDIAGVELTDAMIARGLAAVNWPARLETISTDPLIVIDAGHTPRAVALALQGFQQLALGRPGVLVCGASADKNAGAHIAALAPAFGHIVCTGAHHKGAPPAAIAAFAAEANPDAEILIAENVSEAQRLAVARARPLGGAVYVAGGLFLAAEFKAAHLGRDPASLAFF